MYGLLTPSGGIRRKLGLYIELFVEWVNILRMQGFTGNLVMPNFV